MVTLLGPRDELLRTIERAFPLLDVHVRGNEISLRGASPEVALVERLVDELLVIIDAGQPLNRDAVERSITMLRNQTRERPADVLTMNIVSNRGRTIRPEDAEPEALRRRDRQAHHRLRHRPGRHRQDLPRDGQGRGGAAGQAGQPDHPDPARGRGRGAARLPARHPQREDRPLPAAALRRAARHDRPGLDPAADGRRHHRGRAPGVHAGPGAAGRRAGADAGRLPRRSGSLRVGDLVIGSDGGRRRCSGVYPQGARTIYRVTTQDGASTLACGEHLWAVATRDDKRAGRTRTGSQTTREMIGQLRAAHYTGTSCRSSRAVAACAAGEVPMDPYALGLLLGDGCIDDDDDAVVRDGGPRARGGTRGGADRHRAGHEGRVRLRPAPPRRAPWWPCIVANPVTVAVRELGLAGTRSARSSCPGSTCNNSARCAWRCSRASSTPTAARSLQAGRRPAASSTRRRSTAAARRRHLPRRSLGGVAYCRTRPRRVVSRDAPTVGPSTTVHDAHVIDIRLPEDVEPFRLARKRERVRRSTAVGRPMRFIDSIEPGRGARRRSASRSAAADSLYVTDDFLVTHNTLNDSFIILDEAQNTSAEQMKMFLTRLGFGSKMVVTGDVTQVDLPGGTTRGCARFARSSTASTTSTSPS